MSESADKAFVTLDATILSTLMSCPRLADFRFNHDLQALSGKSPSLEMGSIVHAYLEHFYKAKIQGMKRVDAHGFGMSAATAYIASEEVTNSSKDETDFALQTCELYYENYQNESWTPLEVECTKGKQIYEDDEICIMWKAKHDLIADTGGVIESVDHKTMKQRRDTLSLNNQFMGQCILTNARKVWVNKIGFQKSLPPKERFARVPVHYSPNRLIEWRSQIVPYWAKMMVAYAQSEYWPPNFTHCENKYGFCQFRDVCEADTNIREQTIAHFFKKGEPWSI